MALTINSRFFSNELGGSVSVKFLSETVPTNMLMGSIESTNLNKCFKKNGNPTLPQECAEYEKYLEKNPLQGSLRIHITIPNVFKNAARTQVVGNDVLVFITQ